jgi:hypothetical protein
VSNRPTIQRTPDAQTGTGHYMSINLRRHHILVTEQILHRADVIAIFQQMRRPRKRLADSPHAVCHVLRGLPGSTPVFRNWNL